MVGEGDIIANTFDIEKGAPKDPPIPSFDITVADCKGKEIDPIIAKTSQKVIDDETFVRSRAFAQF